MKKNLHAVICVIVVCLMFLGGCAQERIPQPPRINYQDLLFDEKEVTRTVTPETDTLYFGFHRQGADTLTDKSEFLKTQFTIDRFSTAKFKRDFTVPDSVINTRGFWVMCNLTRYTGNFPIIVYPEKITQPCFLKLHFQSGTLQDSMTINLIPAMR